MARIVPLLITLMLATSVLAGCFGGDDDNETATPDTDGGIDGDGNETVGSNNTTQIPEDANEAPVPALEVSFEVGNNTTTGGRVTLSPGDDATLVLDGSASIDPDGEIDLFAWSVIGPDRTKESSNDPIFRLNLTNFEEFGVWNVTLKTLDGNGTVAGLTQQVSFDYTETQTSQFGMRGAGDASAERESGEEKAGRAALPTANVWTGTYDTQTFPVHDVLKNLTIEVTYEDDAIGAELKLYLFPPGTSDEDTATAEPIAESELGSDGTVTLDVAGPLNETGDYKFRVDLDGSGSVEPYTFTVHTAYALADE